MSATITRRELFGLLGGALAYQAARKTYFFAPPKGWRVDKSGLFTPGEAMFFLPADRWKLQYAYRNLVTGCVSDATPDPAKLKHTFVYPQMDVLEIY